MRLYLYLENKLTMQWLTLISVNNRHLYEEKNSIQISQVLLFFRKCKYRKFCYFSIFSSGTCVRYVMLVVIWLKKPSAFFPLWHLSVHWTLTLCCTSIYIPEGVCRDCDGDDDDGGCCLKIIIFAGYIFSRSN